MYVPSSELGLHLPQVNVPPPRVREWGCPNSGEKLKHFAYSVGMCVGVGTCYWLVYCICVCLWIFPDINRWPRDIAWHPAIRMVTV
jgi:hypothetical protein